MSGIYIHWPFCISKCPYCDFYSKVDNSVDQDELIKEYLDDLSYYKQYVDDEIRTIFFGGGTPSLIKPHNIEKILDHIRHEYKCGDLEISLEANPNSNHKTMFADLKNAGINRLSLGIQSLNEDNLRFLGRSHNKAQAMQAIDEVLKIFDNHSMDVMLGAPNAEDIEYINKLGFKHLSVYQLTIEEGTLFYKQGMEEMAEEEAVTLYDAVAKKLSNYKKYEVSNFAKDGFECKHNMGYWQGLDYVGVGKGAHGRLKMMATEHRRQMEELSGMERAEELLIMGLRIVEGINKERFYKQCGIRFDDFINQDKLQEFVGEGLLIDDEVSFKASQKGFYVLNKIIEDLLVF